MFYRFRRFNEKIIHWLLLVVRYDIDVDDDFRIKLKCSTNGDNHRNFLLLIINF